MADKFIVGLISIFGEIIKQHNDAMLSVSSFNEEFEVFCQSKQNNELRANLIASVNMTEPRIFKEVI